VRGFGLGDGCISGSAHLRRANSVPILVILCANWIIPLAVPEGLGISGQLGNVAGGACIGLGHMSQQGKEIFDVADCFACAGWLLATVDKAVLLLCQEVLVKTVATIAAVEAALVEIMHRVGNLAMCDGDGRLVITSTTFHLGNDACEAIDDAVEGLLALLAFVVDNAHHIELLIAVVLGGRFAHKRKIPNLASLRGRPSKQL